MKRFHVWALGMMLIYSTTILAGQGSGNGGDVVICTDVAGVESYELLDLYEAREQHGLEIDRIYNRGTDGVVSAQLQLLKITKWKNYKDYKNRVINFNGRIRLVSTDLVDIPDSFHTYLPPNCRIEQLAINLGNGVIEVNKSLWDNLDATNKGALILHELFYEDLILSGYANSVQARLINAYLLGGSSVLDNSGANTINPIMESLILLPLRSIGLSGQEINHIIKRSPFNDIRLHFINMIFNHFRSDFIITPDLVLDLKRIIDGDDWFDEDKFHRNLFKQYVLSTIYNSIRKLEEASVYLYEPIRVSLLSQLSENLSNDIYSDMDHMKIHALSRFDTSNKEKELIFSIYGDQQRLCQTIVRNLTRCKEDKVRLLRLIQKIEFTSQTDWNFLRELMVEGIGLEELKLIKFLSHKQKIPTIILNELFNSVLHSEFDYYDYESLEFLWLQNFKRLEVVEIFRRELAKATKYDTAIYALEKLAMMDYIPNLVKPLMTEILLTAEFNQDRNYIGYILKIINNNNLELPKKLRDLIILKLKRNDLEKKFSFEHFFYLVEKQKLVNDELINFFAYNLRFKNSLYVGVNESISYIKQVDKFTDYLFSVILQELKLNRNNGYPLIVILDLLIEREIPDNLTYYLRFLLNTHDQTSVKNAIRRLLAQ
jgi:hypothetical protein